jgi:hypothetical protein
MCRRNAASSRPCMNASAIGRPETEALGCMDLYDARITIGQVPFWESGDELPVG